MGKDTLQSVLNIMKHSIKYLDISQKDKVDLLNLLSESEMVLSFYITLKKDGEIQFFKAYRALHNSILGPYKGGVRIDPDLDTYESIGLAMLMTLKNALLGIPFGGSKGGIRVRVDTLSRSEKEHLLREYIKKLSNYIDENKDIPGPDVGIDERDINTIFDEYSKIKGRNVYSIVTGKSSELLGIEFRKVSTGYGVAYITDNVIREIFKNRKPKIAIQGFGNVGANVFRKLFELGYKIYAISDSKGGIYSDEGIDFGEVRKVKEEKRSVSDLSKLKEGVNYINIEDFLMIDCDVLIPAATESVINKDNAERIKAKVIIEAANAPLTDQAYEILNRRGVYIVPDILANSGGVFVSYYEWLKGNGIQNITDEFVESNMRDKMLNLYDSLKRLSTDLNVSLKTAAYIKSLERVYRVSKLRGAL